MPDRVSDYISDPRDAAAFSAQVARLDLLALKMQAHGGRPAADDVRKAKHGVNVLRNLLAIETTRRRVNGL